MWEIIDNKGVIHSGSEEEMRTAWEYMITGGSHLGADMDLISKYCTSWEGDLKLIQVHEIHN